VPAAIRVDPKDFFTPDEWARLSVRSSWRGLALVAHAWLVIFATMAVAVVWTNPVTVVIAIMIIGCRQLGLAILMHDAAHGCIHPVLAVNDRVGEWLCGRPVGANLARYRPYHLQHHKFTQQPEDPDLVLSAPFPTTRRSLQRKILRDLSGQTFFKQRVQPYFTAVQRGRAQGQSAAQIFRTIWAHEGQFLICNLVLLAGLSLAGAWWAYFVFWLLPLATWYQMITRLRNIAEHACMPDNNDPLRHARTTRANWIERALIAPYYVNYHCEHHMFMHLPCWSLPRAHALLSAKGTTARMEVRTGYPNVLSSVSRKPERTGAAGTA
jgi:fatty acid desaturase